MAIKVDSVDCKRSLNMLLQVFLLFALQTAASSFNCGKTSQPGSYFHTAAGVRFQPLGEVFPWTVLIGQTLKSEPKCLGALVVKDQFTGNANSTDLVLTATSCIEVMSPVDSRKMHYVVTDIGYDGSFSMDRAKKSIKNIEKYKQKLGSKQMQRGVAVLTLKEPIYFNQEKSPVCIATFEWQQPDTLPCFMPLLNKDTQRIETWPVEVQPIEKCSSKQELATSGAYCGAPMNLHKPVVDGSPLTCYIGGSLYQFGTHVDQIAPSKTNVAPLPVFDDVTRYKNVIVKYEELDGIIPAVDPEIEKDMSSSSTMEDEVDGRRPQKAPKEGRKRHGDVPDTLPGRPDKGDKSRPAPIQQQPDRKPAEKPVRKVFYVDPAMKEVLSKKPKTPLTAESRQRPTKIPSYPDEESRQRPIKKPGYQDAESRQRPIKKPSYPDEESRQRPIKKPSYPDEESRQRPIKKPSYPDEESRQRPIKKPSYPDEESRQRPIKKPSYPVEDSRQRPVRKPGYLDEESRQRPIKKPTHPEEESRQRPVKKPSYPDEEPKRRPIPKAGYADEESRQRPVEKPKYPERDTGRMPPKTTPVSDTAMAAKRPAEPRFDATDLLDVSDSELQSDDVYHSECPCEPKPTHSHIDKKTMYMFAEESVHIVKLEQGHRPEIICSGSLVAASEATEAGFVLTAAACVWDKTVSKYGVYLGSQSELKQSMAIPMERVDEIITYPAYKQHQGLKAMGVAIMKLNHSIPFTASLEALTLPEELGIPLEKFDQCFVSGVCKHGRAAFSAALVLSSKQCASRLDGDFYEGEYCAILTKGALKNPKGAALSCYGDDGWKQYGVFEFVSKTGSLDGLYDDDEGKEALELAVFSQITTYPAVLRPERKEKRREPKKDTMKPYLSI